jgi:hypothetical protein
MKSILLPGKRGKGRVEMWSQTVLDLWLSSCGTQDRHNLLKRSESKVSCFTNTQPIIKCFEKHLSLMG